MKRINNFLAINRETEEMYQETLTRVLQHPKTKALIQENDNVTPQMIENDLLVVDEYIRAHSEDVPCESVEACTNNPKGYTPKVDVRNNRIHLIYEPCESKKREDEYHRRKQLIDAQFVSQDIKDATFESIQHYPNTNRKDVHQQLMKKAFDIINEKHHKGLYLHGKFGVGKSYFLGALANEISKYHISSVLLYVPEFISRLKGGFSDGSTQRLLDTVKTAEVLILDDLGAEDVTPWVRDEVISNILHYRMVEHLPTFISSNFTMAEIEMNYRKTRDNGVEETKSRRILERLRALCDEVELKGDNYRNK
ncbi:primosomal protein DnaI [Aliicoccus persicus]|uniref:Replicative DNA helicase loader DnaI n=1 Tax=Aliicoccus persicus TaxID=930138 RepID=A0A662Z3L4_9STAP|nr:primosomal protein DnaI [Aliicoccus persicus]SEV86690.1 replicative DNA helicase loader DnaI [Aliicoccus persicus]